MDATFIRSFLNIIDAMLQDLLFFFQSSVMRSFKIFCSVIEHHSFYVLRSSLQVSSIIDARQILSSICYHGCCYARRCSLQFSNSAETSSKIKIKPHYMPSLFFFMFFPFFLSSDIRPSQLISPHLALPHLSSFHVRADMLRERCGSRHTVQTTMHLSP